MDKAGEVYRVKSQISPRFEASAVIKRLEERFVVYLEKIKGHNMPVAAGLCATRKRLYKALNVSSSEEFYLKLLNALDKPLKCRRISKGQTGRKMMKVDLRKLPVLTHYEADGGPYITASLVAALSPDGETENVSIHRLQVLDGRKLAIRLVPRNLYRLYVDAKSKGKPLEVAIAIGVHPALSLAASASPPYGVSEYEVANALLNGKLKLVKCHRVEAYFPADSEIVLEGKILPDAEVSEGPFADLTGTYDAVRSQPVIEILAIHHREKPIYQSILPAGLEHKLLMGIGREAKIWKAVKEVVPKIGGVNLTSGGGGWLHAIISVEKQVNGDVKNVVMAAFAAHPSLKHVVVVDLDVDVYNLEEVEWAIATRFQGKRGLLVVEDVRGSTLDPSADQISGLTTKIGLDATKPLGLPEEKFRKAKIPGEKKILRRILGEG
jgi:UbiD family decarboxylase